MVDIDTKLLYFINLHHSRWTDPFFIALSTDRTWVFVLIALTAGTLFLRRRRWWKIWFWLMLTLGVTDGFTQFAVKLNVKRVRPCHYMVGLRAPTGCGGRFGFPSNHSANSMALAVLVWLFLGGYWPSLIVLLALLTGYSRVYVAVHFPLDVLAGFVEGAVIAFLIFRLARWTDGWLSRQSNATLKSLGE